MRNRLAVLTSRGALCCPITPIPGAAGYCILIYGVIGIIGKNLRVRVGCCTSASAAVANAVFTRDSAWD